MAVKAVIVAVALVMCIGFLNAAVLNQDEIKEKWGGLAKKCAETTGANQEEIESLRKKEHPTTRNGKCLLACMYKEEGAIKDGKYSAEGFLQSVSQIFEKDSEEYKKYDATIKTCKEEVGEEADECELASKILKCQLRLAGDVKVDF